MWCDIMVDAADVTKWCSCSFLLLSNHHQEPRRRWWWLKKRKSQWNYWASLVVFIWFSRLCSARKLSLVVLLHSFSFNDVKWNWNIFFNDLLNFPQHWVGYININKYSKDRLASFICFNITGINNYLIGLCCLFALWISVSRQIEEIYDFSI